MIKFYIKGQEDPLYQEDDNWNYVCDNYYDKLHREDGPAVILCNLNYATGYYHCLYFLNGKLTGEGELSGFDPKQYLKQLNPSIENLIAMSLDNNEFLREAACEKLRRWTSNESENRAI